MLKASPLGKIKIKYLQSEFFADPEFLAPDRIHCSVESMFNQQGRITDNRCNEQRFARLVHIIQRQAHRCERHTPGYQQHGFFIGRKRLFLYFIQNHSAYHRAGNNPAVQKDRIISQQRDNPFFVIPALQNKMHPVAFGISLFLLTSLFYEQVTGL